MNDIERTDQGEQYVAPGMQTTDREREASVRRLLAEAQRKYLAARRMGDHRFAAVMQAECDYLRGCLRGLRTGAREKQQGSLDL